jgi:uncharacterized protein (DUF1697 family)
MSKYVAMIRGVEPGNPNMAGAKFKSFFEELGFTGVRVVLASGNIIFESPSRNTMTLAEVIEKALPKKLGFKRSVIVKGQLELQNLIDLNPFKGIEQNHNKEAYLLVTFFKQKLNISYKFPYTPENKPYILLGKIDNALYGSIDLSSSKTPDYMAWLEKQFGKEITSRTPKTIRLILSRMNNI